MSTPDEPVDPDVGAADRRPVEADVLAVVALGGAIGAVARWAVLDTFPHAAGEIATATIVVNVVGSLLLGVLMVVVTELLPTQRLVRPFLGVGVLGGFTTFSTAALDVDQMLRAGHAASAVAYLVVSVVASLAAVWVGLAATRVVVRRGEVGS